MKLFEPVQIRKMKIRNRILMAPMHSNLGYQGSRGRTFFEERAKGGVGAIIGYGVPPDLFAKDDAWPDKERRKRFLGGLKNLTVSIQGYGAKIGVQLWYGNRFPAVLKGNFVAGDWIAPAARIENVPAHMATDVGVKMREISQAEIRELLDTYGVAAREIKENGFDFVEIHGAHSYLLSQFFDREDNTRTDGYGGDLAGRMRLGCDCVRRVREEVGEDFPIFFRFPAEDRRPDGITDQDTEAYAQALEEAGVDVLNVSVGCRRDRRGMKYNITPPYDRSYGTYVDLAEAIKQKVNIKVAAVGRINNKKMCEEILGSEKADLITVGRQLVADPEWPNKLASGKENDIRPCIGCCECVDLAIAEQQLRCTVNPRAGREVEFPEDPAKEKKKVVILGGGPAGLEAAATAGSRGHDVILLEKYGKLGGQLNFASVPPHKEKLKSLSQYLEGNAKAGGADIRLNENLSASGIEAMDADVVVLAMGAVPLIPSIPGKDLDNVTDAFEVLAGARELGEKVIVIGGGMIGLEVAEFAASKGRDVTIVEMLAELAQDVNETARVAILKRLDVLGVRVLKSAEVTEIMKDGVRIIESGEPGGLTGESIVLACGMVSNEDKEDLFESEKREVLSIGDCFEVKGLRSAISGGFKIGYKI